MTARRTSTCPQCGRSPAADPATNGLCSACLLATAASIDDPPFPYDVLAPMEEDPRGITYLARRNAAGSDLFVALKVVGAAEGEAVLTRFAACKPALERLRHPGAGKVIDAGPTADGSVYIASDYVAGSPLSEMVARGPLEPGDRVDLARQMTEAVVAAHAAGVVHLQLDASKVKVSTAGGLRASIVGFGLSVIADGRVGGPDIDVQALEALIRRLGL